MVVYARSGRGGAGAVHFHRDRYNSKGGPDGGDGGRGGHVIVQANSQLNTLLHLKHRPHLFASDGDHGRGAKKRGKYGKDKIVEVPLGTLFKSLPEEKQVLEVLEENQRDILLLGGKGGLGNVHFSSSTRQSPRYAQPGLEGEEKTLLVELKLLADVGLVGGPNVGKSTLLSVLSRARPLVADYPFTTLNPILGVVPHDEHRFVMADLPGLLPGASEGKGRGQRFLQHAERNRMLLLVIPAWKKDLLHERSQLLHELKSYNADMLKKPRLIGFSQSDLCLGTGERKRLEDACAQCSDPALYFSSFSQEGLEALKQELWKKLSTA